MKYLKYSYNYKYQMCSIKILRFVTLYVFRMILRIKRSNRL
jgi:hypothetical protein